MALARLALRNLQQRVSSNTAAVSRQELLKRFMTTTSATVTSEENKDKKEVPVTQKKSSRSLFPWRRSKRRSPWRNNDVPALYEFFPSGLGNALVQATENINRLLDNLNISPVQLLGRVKEDDKSYKLRYEVPGLSKEEVKITIDDGVLSIKGEHKEEEGSDDEDEHWSSRSYGYYNTSVVLPDDAKVDDIKAELKDGVLSIIVPKSEVSKKNVKHVQIH